MPRESLGQLPRRILLSAQQQGNSFAAHRTGMPCFQHGVACLKHFFQHKGTPVEQYGHNLLSAFSDCFQQIYLILRKLYLAHRHRLATVLRAFAQADDCDIAFTDCCNGRRHIRIVQFSQLAAYNLKVRFGHHLLQPFLHTDSLFRLSLHAPSAQQIGLVRSKRTDNGYRGRFLYRQSLVPVLQQYHGRHSQLARQVKVFLRKQSPLFPLRIKVSIRVVKQSEAEFYDKCLPCRLCDVVCRHGILFRQIQQMTAVLRRSHIHFQPAVHAPAGSFLAVGRSPFGNGMTQGCPVGDKQSFKFQLSAKHIMIHEPVHGDRLSVIRSIRTHQRPHAGIDGSLKGRQILFLQVAQRKVRILIIASSP